MPTICNAIHPPSRATLMSHRNTLSGEYSDVWAETTPRDPGGELIYCSYGTLSLTRLPNAEAP